MQTHPIRSTASLLFLALLSGCVGSMPAHPSLGPAPTGPRAELPNRRPTIPSRLRSTRAGTTARAAAAAASPLAAPVQGAATSRATPPVATSRTPATAPTASIRSTARTRPVSRRASPGTPRAESTRAHTAGDYVRLRGTNEIHIRSCPRVRRADAEGIVPAKRSDGPPCYFCLRDRTRTVSRAAPSRPARTVSRASRPAVHRAPTSAPRYVRLRGSVEIHLADCPRVRRAASQGVVPAKKDDGPPCYYCRKDEALKSYRSLGQKMGLTIPRTSGPTHPAEYAKAGPPACRPGSFVRLRGAVEIHTPDCPRVRRAAPGGAQSARSDDGPPCYHCRKREAMAWSQ